MSLFLRYIRKLEVVIFFKAKMEDDTPLSFYDRIKRLMATAEDSSAALYLLKVSNGLSIEISSQF